MALRNSVAVLLTAILVLTVGSSVTHAAQRVVLFEESTNWGCPPCFTYNPDIHTMLEGFGDQVAAVKWHVWWPDGSDPYYNHNITPVQQRIAYYGITAAPDVVIDGVNSASPASPPAMTNQINGRLAVSSPVSISCDGLVVGGGFGAGTCNINVDVNVETVQPAADYRIFVALVEEHIFQPSPNGETDHYDVFRHGNNGNTATGEPIDLTVAGPKPTFAYSYPLDASYNPVDMGVRVWIQNYTTRELIQAAKAELLVPYLVQSTSTTPAAQIGSPTDPVTFGGEIENVGANTDTYDVSLAGVPAGWTYSYTTPAGTFSGPSTLTLTSGQVGAISLTLDSQGTPGPATVTLSFASQNEPLNSTSLEFQKLNGLDVLIVDDDAGDARETQFVPSLEAAGVTFGTWHQTDGELTTTDLENAASIIMWMCGAAYPTLNDNERTTIGTYLDNGGNLFLSGSDITFDLAGPFSPNQTPATIAWHEQYLHSSYNSANTSVWQIMGTPGDPIGDPIFLTGLSPTGPNGAFSPDGILPGPGANISFTYASNPSDAGINWAGGHKVVYFSFGFEAITLQNIRDLVMQGVIDFFGLSTAVSDPELAAPQIALSRNVPNPFRPSTQISYQLLTDGAVSLRVFDVNGRVVRELVSEHQAAQLHEVTWDGRDDAGRAVSSGVYFYKLEAPGVAETRRMVLSR